MNTNKKDYVCNIVKQPDILLSWYWYIAPGTTVILSSVLEDYGYSFTYMGARLSLWWALRKLKKKHILVYHKVVRV